MLHAPTVPFNIYSHFRYIAIKVDVIFSRMDYDFTPSLLSMAVLRITIALWYNADVLTNYERTRKCSVILSDEKKMAEKVLTLPLPTSLQKRILSLMHPVGQQINQWVRTNKKFLLSFKVGLYTEVHWTAFGLIDFAQTAENIIQSSDFSPFTAYEFACINGAGSEVCRLWPAARSHIPPNSGNNQMEVDNTFDEVWHWTTLLSEKFPSSNVHLHSIEKDFFVRGLQRSLASHNDATAKFYFQNLNYSRQLKFLREATIPSRDPCLWEWEATMQFFFLTCMNEEQKDDFFNKYPAEALVIFLKWPLRNFFYAVVDKGVSLISADELLNLSTMILNRMEYYEYEAEFYKDLFKDMWCSSPMVSKKACFNELMSRILTDLFKPFSLKKALAIAFDDDDAEANVMLTFFSDIDVMLYFITAKSKRQAFETVVEKYMPKEACRKFSKDVYSSLTVKSKYK